jgi:hypothetical protein
MDEREASGHAITELLRNDSSDSSIVPKLIETVLDVVLRVEARLDIELPSAFGLLAAIDSQQRVLPADGKAPPPVACEWHARIECLEHCDDISRPARIGDVSRVEISPRIRKDVPTRSQLLTARDGRRQKKANDDSLESH